MIKLRFFLALTLILFSLYGTSNGFSGEGKNKVLKLINGFKKYKKGNQGSIKNIEKILDLDFIGKRAINLHWKKMSSSQKKKFISIFKKLVEKLAFSKSSKYFRENKYVIVKESNKKVRDYLLKRKKEKFNVLTVTMKIDYKTKTGTKKETCTFYLIKQNNKLVIFDVEILGGSLVKDYRNQFSRTIRKKGGIDGMIKTMEDKYNE